MINLITNLYTAVISSVYLNISCVILGVLFVIWFVKPIRWYILSYKFPWLYNHKKAAGWLGVKFVSDQEFKTNRTESKLYLQGVFVKFFEWFTGMSVSPKDAHRKGLMRIQGFKAKFLDFKPYFDKWENNKKLTGEELEEELSNIVLTETNRVFEVFTREQEEEMRKYLGILRAIINGLTGGEKGALSTLYNNFWDVLKLRRLLLSVSENERMLVFTPQLTFVNNSARMIMLREATITDDFKFQLKDDIDFSVPRRVHFRELEANHFLLPTSFYFVFIVNGNLTLIERQRDYKNTSANKAFGPMGFQCPGKHYTIKAIKSIISFFQAMEATIEGKPIISGGRFPDITNKKDIIMTFHKTSEYVQPNDEIPDYSECDGNEPKLKQD